MHTSDLVKTEGSLMTRDDLLVTPTAGFQILLLTIRPTY